MATNKQIKQDQKDNVSTPPLTCGLIMPISSIDGCSSEHWTEVKSIITDAIEGIFEPRFIVKLVSDSDDVGVIQKRIVQNIYNSDIVVCDVSGKNPNVMFELGMRLAFDKPTVIVKDDKTEYAFDTGIIEHVAYPRDLRFSKIVSFKSLLSEKVLATHKAASSDPNHSTFLKNFGKFHAAKLTEDIIPADKLVLEMLSDLQNEVSQLRRVTIRDDYRRVREKNMNEAEAYSRINQAIEAFCLDNKNTKLTDIFGQKTFYDYMEGYIDAPNYFSGPKELYRAVDNVMLNLMKKGE